MRLAWAVRRLDENVGNLPPAPSPEVEANRREWLEFVDEDLVGALKAYESAGTVIDRVAAGEAIQRKLEQLEARHQTHVWNPSLNLAAALKQAFSKPNANAVVDFSTFASFASRQIVQPEVLFRQGQYSYITPGPYGGFGLLSSEDGIAFFNKQVAYSHTPIRDFNQQVAQADPRGERLTNMYTLCAETRGVNNNTAVTILRPSGMQISTQTDPRISFAVGLAPAPGGGTGRLIASLIGLGPEKIRQKIYEEALPRVQADAARGAREEAAERIAAAQAKINAQLASYLIGNNAAVYDKFAVTNLSFMTRPTHVQAQGLVRDRVPGLWSGLPGADMPEPVAFRNFEPGVTADVHLPSIGTNVLSAFFSSPEIQGVESLMVETTKPVEGAEVNALVQTTKNVDFAGFAEAVQTYNDNYVPGSALLWIQRPAKSPVVSVDANGKLVLLIEDFDLMLAKQPGIRIPFGATDALIYRVESPLTEVVFDVKLETPGPGIAPSVVLKLLSLDTGPNVVVTALNQDESAGVRQNALVRAALLGTIQSRLQARADPAAGREAERAGVRPGQGDGSGPERVDSVRPESRTIRPDERGEGLVRLPPTF